MQIDESDFESLFIRYLLPGIEGTFDGDIDTYIEGDRAHVSIVSESKVLVGPDGSVLDALQLPALPDGNWGAVVLGIITGVKGSSPQKLGAKALFYPDRKIKGTLGGGCVEAEVKQRALRVLNTGGGQPTTTKSSVTSAPGRYSDGR